MDNLLPRQQNQLLILIFPVLTLFYFLSLPKIWLSDSSKNYIFEVSNKVNNVIFKIVNLVAIWI